MLVKGVWTGINNTSSGCVPTVSRAAVPGGAACPCGLLANCTRYCALSTFFVQPTCLHSTLLTIQIKQL